jgi:hypothetical protein
VSNTYDYLEQFLKKNLYGNNPLFAQLFGNAQRGIGRTTDRNVRGLKNQFAQSGFRGIGGNMLNDAYRTESDTLGQVQGQIGQMQLQDQQFNINSLLGLENLKSQERAQETDFWDVLAGLGGSVAGGLGGGFGGAWGNQLFKKG